jgi:hypothetical protein
VAITSIARTKAARALGLANNSVAASFTLSNIGISSFIHRKVIFLLPLPYQIASYISQQISAKSPAQVVVSDIPGRAHSEPNVLSNV